MTFSKQLDQLNIPKHVHNSLLSSPKSVEKTLQQTSWSLADFTTLLSPAATAHLEVMAHYSQRITRQRFGKAVQLFAPLYLSNECFNTCTYCGFSMHHDYPRKTLSDSEILEEARILRNRGFQHVLLLTGEAPKTVGIDYISRAITLLHPHFASIGIEVQPFSLTDYQTSIHSGADLLTLYQETYHRDTYAAHHLYGKKRLFDHRLDAVEAGAEAGFFRINIGALLGLYDWRYEAISLAFHLDYLQKKYWKVKYGVSFPRIQKMYGNYTTLYPVLDRDLVQFIAAFRMVFPDIHITLSTREPQTLRDNLVPLGITTMSAESSTSPGGYAELESEEQFQISDLRSLNEIKALLTQKGLDPVTKDWDDVFLTTPI